METFGWQDRNGVRWIQLEGELDHQVILELQDRLDEAVAESDGDVVFVMEGVSFLGSMAIGVLLHQQKKVAARGNTLYLKGLRPSIRTILGSMNLLEVFSELDG